MGVAIRDGYVQFSALDAVSHLYTTGKGLGRFKGVAYWLFCWKVTIPESALIKQIWSYRDAKFNKSYLKSRSVAVVGSDRFAALPMQQYKNSCAARCLQQAAYELGVKKIPNNQLYGFNGQSIRYRSTEAAIYGVTGSLLCGSGGLKQNLRGDLNNGSYSSPVGIKNAARLLGLDSRFYCSSRVTDWYFGQSDPHGWKEIKRSCPVHRTSPPELCRNERLLLHVCNYSMFGFDDQCLSVRRDHFIMQRPDGSCYDPHKGINYPSVQDYAKKTGIKPSGVSMLISSKDAYAKLPFLRS
ncbi:hypothetical protein [Endozoicomonas sp. SCSIO W0465]|uniref:hypothetical protein n=1 Tax=Endozoicomonas sp. SCSIO W0465 TaxID=2918516 RepID=UPI0020751434|nr:hypothetical protein [Endozoicomonas sp. SCSIO W0465]USE34889.1 hypothetical protein MJO57_22580 [Endozoicomonas sp. SCSIO W0465]